MKRLALVPAVVLSALPLLAVLQVHEATHVAAGARRRAAVRSEAGAVAERIAGGRWGREDEPTMLGTFGLFNRSRDEVRRRLREGEAGTYIGEILLNRDSALARWRDRRTSPLKVWVQPAPAIPDWDPLFAEEVREAFLEWASVGIPVPFAFAADSNRADVHVTWTDHFPTPISGKTRWARDEGWWIVDAHIVLAVHHSSGEPLDTDAVKAIALHEVGHLLGLDHSADPQNIMTSRVRVRSLSPADRATIRLLYTLPAGVVR